MQLPNNEVKLVIQEPLLPKVRGDRVFRLNISRNTLIAFIVSILIHAVLLIVALPKIDFDKPIVLPPPIEVTLAPPVAETLPEILPPPEPLPEQKPEPKKPKVMTQKPKPNVKPEFTVPEEMAPKVETKPTLAPPKVDAAPKDMSEYIKMQQAKRQGTESDAARQNAEAVAKEIGPTAEQIRDERIKKNLEAGSGGIFSVSNVSTREATLTFNGWKNSFSASQVRSYLVVASDGQDIRRMVVKKAISLIRIDYPKEFPWESRRLGMTITKSSRLEDNAELEAFLLIEFSDMYRN